VPLSAVVVLAVGWAYGWVAVHSTVPGWSSAVYAVALGLCAGAVPWLLARPLRVRSTAALRGLAAANGIAVLYLAWGSFLAAVHTWVLGESVAGAAGEATTYWSDPARTWAAAERIAPAGWFDLAGIRPRGVLLWTLWAFEVGTVLAVAVLLAPRRIAGRTLCVPCGAWLADEKPLRIPADEGALSREVRDRGLAAVQHTAAPSLGASKWIRVDLRTCPGCARREFALGQEITARLAGGRGSATVVRALQPWAPVDESVAHQLERIRGLLKTADTARFDAFKADREAAP